MTGRVRAQASLTALLLTAITLLLLVVATENPVQARAGGGQSYSSGSKSSSSSNSSRSSIRSSSSSSSGVYSSSSRSSGGSSSSSRSSGSRGSNDTVTYTTRVYSTGRSDPPAAEVTAMAAAAHLPNMYFAGYAGAANPLNVLFSVMSFVFTIASLAVLEMYVSERLGYTTEEAGSGTADPVSGGANLGAQGVAVQEPGKRSESLDRLRTRDPGFDESRFLERAKSAFAMIQQAWSHQDLAPVQAFLSDSVFERFALQINELKRQGIRDVMEDLTILDATVVNIESDVHFDTLSVLVKARAVNYRQRFDSGEMLDGSRDPQEFAEVWSFVRRLGARTSAKPGLIEGSCPNCGAPIEVSRAAICKSCQSFLRSGEYDWVLAEITQTCEWVVKQAAAVQGEEKFRSIDPGFNIQHIEDRASLMFWRRLDCFLLGSVEPMLKCASPEYVGEIAKAIAPGAAGERPSYLNAAVGSVELRLVVQQEPMDQLVVEIRWSARPVKVNQAGQVIDGHASQPVNTRELFILHRKHGATTDTRLSLSSTHCPGCGAPETTAADNLCPFCRTAFNDGAKEWILSHVARNKDREYRALKKMA